MDYRVRGEHRYKNVLLPGYVNIERIKIVEKLQFTDDDVLIVSAPKSGTTLTQHLVYLVRRNGEVEDEKANIADRVPYLVEDWEKPDDETFVKEFYAQDSPRMHATNLPLHIFKDAVERQKTRVVYVMRNPKDVLTSYYHFYRANFMWGRFPGSWDDFFEMAMAEKMNGLVYGSMFEHVLGYWKLRHLPNILLMRYEDFVNNPSCEIRRVAAFCGKGDMTDATIKEIAQATSFDAMKKNPATNFETVYDYKINHFYRKGKIGDWKNYFTIKQNERFEALMEEKLAGTGIEFTFE